MGRIHLNIFRNRDEYLREGMGPPVEWSAGHFTGSAVETYIGEGGFEGMVQTLFHEAAHQFVGLATNAVGWLNEGLASFFEGCRLLPNGTVLMNMPANHRLFPLAERMERGWMAQSREGIDPANPDTTPDKAPTFRIIIENDYEWAPPWYAPTWGVVYFLYNYQDPLDGRFIYRDAFREFIDKSGGRMGEGAVENFEQVVLANPQRPTKGVDVTSTTVKLPRTMAELDAVWKDWILALRDEQAGRVEAPRPYLDWARHALTRGDLDDALEHFEKGIAESPRDVELLVEFARFLSSKRKNDDRAAKLVRQALRVLESESKVDAKRIDELDKLLAKFDPKHRSLLRLHEELRATACNLCQRYLTADLALMAMDVSWYLGTELGLTDVFRYFEEAVRRSGKSLWTWQLAYNEHDLRGWLASELDVFVPDGPTLRSRFGAYEEKKFDYRFLIMDKVTSGDFSFEAEVLARQDANAFCGLVFGKKHQDTFHCLIFFPGRTGEGDEGERARSGYVDLTTFYGLESFKTWRHNPVTSTQDWHKLRVDLVARTADVWFDDELVVSHEFPSLDVMRGSFGLITGPGEACFRNVHYVARPPLDRGAQIEREVRLERTKSAPGNTPTAARESYLGEVAPWLAAAQWVREPRTSWQEAGPVPTLLLFWSIAQNELIPLHGWLEDLAARTRDIDLQFVSIAAPDDASSIESYLQAHPFPGSVGVDVRKHRGYGELFETYSIQRFNTPRLLLLDIDQRVVWEGDPGITFNEPWQPGMETYLDVPLDELVAKRSLRELCKWRHAWQEVGRTALKEGDLAKVAALLKKAASFDKTLVPEAREACDALESLENTLGSLEVVARTLERSEREPAMKTLIDWAKLLEKEIDAKTRKTLQQLLRHPRTKAWDETATQAGLTLKRLHPGKERDELEKLLKKLDAQEDPFSAALRTQLTAALEANDLGQARRLLEGVDLQPGSWLARELFRW
ncbi:MAG: family 16 glycoside hydrolase [Planctomycetota bacterium]